MRLTRLAVNRRSLTEEQQAPNTSLDRSDTFSGWEDSELAHNKTPQNSGATEDVIDEETWNWPVLMTRVFCFFLLFIIMVMFGLGALDSKFLVVGAIIFVLLSIILINTYVNLVPLARKYICCCCYRVKMDSESTIRTPLNS